MAGGKSKNIASTRKKLVAGKGKTSSSGSSSKKASPQRAGARKRKDDVDQRPPAKAGSGNKRVRKIERVAQLWEALGQLSFKQILKMLEGNLKKGRGLTKRAKKR